MPTLGTHIHSDVYHLGTHAQQRTDTTAQRQNQLSTYSLVINTNTIIHALYPRLLGFALLQICRGIDPTSLKRDCSKNALIVTVHFVFYLSVLVLHSVQLLGDSSQEGRMLW